jgi:cytochrome c553
VPALSAWPNHGVGRVNPDGSRGACSSCHPRHSFDIAVARQPRTCAQCHLAPDVPAWEVYRESKHGNLALSFRQNAEYRAVPWKVGADFRAPTCATCHNALVTSPGGDVIAERTHDFGARLWVRIFGLPYATAQPKDGRTYLIKNADRQPLSSTFTNQHASAFLIDGKEQQRRQDGMAKLCRACHATDYARQHFAALAKTVHETNAMTLTATKLMQRAWKQGKASPKNPFDEELELLWTKQWLFYANSVRYGAAMGGPDYMSFKNGWWSMSHDLEKLENKVAGKR